MRAEKPSLRESLVRACRLSKPRWSTVLSTIASVHLCLGCQKPGTGANDAFVSARVEAKPEIFADSSPLAHSRDYIVAAGLRWLVTFDASLLANVRRVTPELLPPNNVQSFERSVGLNVAQVHDVSIAGFDYSTLYVVRGVPDVRLTRDRFASRIAVEPSVNSIGAKQLYTGMVANDVQHYATLDENTALWSTGDPSTAKAALLLAQRQLKRSPPALRGVSLAPLPQHCKQGQVLALVPGPIELPPEANSQASLVLGATLALAISATIEGDALDVKLCWLGDWPTEGIARTRSVVDAVLNSRLASLLDLTERERRGAFTHNGDLVEIAFHWAAAKVLRQSQRVLTLDLPGLFSPDP